MLQVGIGWPILKAQFNFDYDCAMFWSIVIMETPQLSDRDQSVIAEGHFELPKK